MLKIDKRSHLDHGLTEAMVGFILGRFGDRDGFFIETVELPEQLGMLSCGLHGPIMGDPPVQPSEVTLQRRGERAWVSRMVARAPRETRIMTVIAGPHGEDKCVLYTAFGGPKAEREPQDPAITTADEWLEAESFWSQHALSL